jgi:uncharacterized RmlC-like cupin family protein
MTDHSHDNAHDQHEHWKHHGVQVIKGDRLDPNTAQTQGMFRQAAINHARVGAQKIWAGTVSIQPNAKTGVHHHGELESVIYVVRGKARMRWGERLEFVVEASCLDARPPWHERRPEELAAKRLNRVACSGG